MYTLVSYCLNAVRVHTSSHYHGYGAYVTFLWHNSFYNVLPDPSLGLGLELIEVGYSSPNIIYNNQAQGVLVAEIFDPRPVFYIVPIPTHTFCHNMS